MSYRNVVNWLLNNRKLIIGLGSGRCGTASLASLLSQQENTYASHESYTHDGFHLHGYSDSARAMFALVDMLGRDDIIVSDVAYYWLKFVPHVRSFKGIIKFICLKRDKNQFVRSLFKKPMRNPAVIGGDTQEHFEDYYDHYYKIADQYVETYPEFKIYDTDMLNSEDGQREMLNFLGYKNHVYDVGIKLNVN